MVKEVYKSETHAGNSSVLNMEFNLMVKCLQIKLLEVVMMHSIHSSLKLELESMSQELSSSIFNQLLLMKSEQELIDNFSILNNSSQEKKMLQTISLEDIILLVKKSLTFAWTESEN